MSDNITTTDKNIKEIDRTEALGHASIKRLLFEYGGPAIVAMTASSLYNMVDSIFIEKAGLELTDEELDNVTGGFEQLSNNPRVVHLIRSNVTL